MKKLTEERNRKICAEYQQLFDLGVLDIVGELSKTFKLGRSYIKLILGSNDIIIRSTHPGDPMMSAKENAIRDICDKYKTNISIAEIADTYMVPISKVEQILRTSLEPSIRAGIVPKIFDLVKADIERNVSHRDLIKKYSTTLLRKVNTVLKVNIFNLCVAQRNKRIVELHNNGKQAAEIATEVGVVRDYVYGILKESGIRTRPTITEYSERNEDIRSLFKNGRTSKEIAEKYNMTITNVNIILKNIGARN